MLKESFCIKVPKIHGEKTLILTNKLGISDRQREIQKDTNFIYIPLIRQPENNDLAMLKTQVPDLQLEKHVFPEKKRQEKTFVTC